MERIWRRGGGYLAIANERLSDRERESERERER